MYFGPIGVTANSSISKARYGVKTENVNLSSKPRKKHANGREAQPGTAHSKPGISKVCRDATLLGKAHTGCYKKNCECECHPKA